MGLSDMKSSTLPNSLDLKDLSGPEHRTIQSLRRELKAASEKLRVLEHERTADDTFRRKSHDALRELGVELRDVVQENSALRQRISHLESKFVTSPRMSSRDHCENCTSLREEITSLRSSLIKSNSDHVSATEELNSIMEEYGSLKHENKVLCNRIEELLDEVNNLGNSGSFNREEVDRLTELIEKLEHEKKNLTETINSLNNCISEKDTDLSNVQTEFDNYVEEASQQISDLQSSLSDALEDNHQLQSDKYSIQAEYQIDLESLQKSVIIYQNQAIKAQKSERQALLKLAKLEIFNSKNLEASFLAREKLNQLVSSLSPKSCLVTPKRRSKRIDDVSYDDVSMKKLSMSTGALNKKELHDDLNFKNLDLNTSKGDEFDEERQRVAQKVLTMLRGEKERNQPPLIEEVESRQSTPNLEGEQSVDESPPEVNLTLQDLKEETGNQEVDDVNKVEIQSNVIDASSSSVEELSDSEEFVFESSDNEEEDVEELKEENEVEVEKGDKDDHFIVEDSADVNIYIDDEPLRDENDDDEVVEIEAIEPEEDQVLDKSEDQNLNQDSKEESQNQDSKQEGVQFDEVEKDFDGYGSDESESDEEPTNDQSFGLNTILANQFGNLNKNTHDQLVVLGNGDEEVSLSDNDSEPTDEPPSRSRLNSVLLQSGIQSINSSDSDPQSKLDYGTSSANENLVLSTNSENFIKMSNSNESPSLVLSSFDVRDLVYESDGQITFEDSVPSKLQESSSSDLDATSPGNGVLISQISDAFMCLRSFGLDVVKIPFHGGKPAVRKLWFEDSYLYWDKSSKRPKKPPLKSRISYSEIESVLIGPLTPTCGKFLFDNKLDIHLTVSICIDSRTVDFATRTTGDCCKLIWGLAAIVPQTAYLPFGGQLHHGRLLRKIIGNKIKFLAIRKKTKVSHVLASAIRKIKL
ncbi:hypothetical protein GEMRC1_007290 [Eukaryota sp. GEM-RC1]